MSEDCGFNVFFAPMSSGDERMKVDEAARESSLERCPTVPGTASPRASYARRGLAPLTVTFQPGGLWPQCGIYPLSRETFEQYGAETIGGFLKQLCLRLDAVFGRSFKEDLHAVAYEREIDGQLEYIEWFQYLGPAMVARWGRDHLRRGPFHRVEVLPGGACALWLRESPYDATERESTKRGADYLGIKLRPHFIKDSSGKLVPLDWP